MTRLTDSEPGHQPEISYPAYLHPSNNDGNADSFQSASRSNTKLDVSRQCRVGKPSRTSTAVLPRILVVDDDRSVILLIESALRGLAEVTSATSVSEAQQALEAGTFETVLLDLWLPDGKGTEIFAQIRAVDEALPVILMTASASSNSAIAATRAGMWDFISKPLAVDSLQTLVVNALRQRSLALQGVAICARPLTPFPELDSFIGNSPEMIRVFKTIGRVSRENVPVLICGESGTGKELVANALHGFSDRAKQPFTAVNCAALSEGVLESELFGHEKGAFTGADKLRLGKFEQCSGGTLFLDEIGDMTLTIQAKVLRVLQQQRFHRVGGNTEIHSDVRILAATNRPLKEMVKAGTFREDLWYRLNGVTVDLPALRERMSDVPALIQRFLVEACEEFGRSELRGISQEALDLMMNYSWPGNVRQLRDVIRESVIQTSLTVIDPEALPLELRSENFECDGDPSAETQATSHPPDRQRSDGNPFKSRPAASTKPMASGQPSPAGSQLHQIVDGLLETSFGEVYAGAIQYVEKYVLLRALEKTGGNRTQAAALLGIARSKLRDRIAVYNISISPRPGLPPEIQEQRSSGG